jgi:hypothetical protein
MTPNRRYFCYFLTTTLLFLAVSWVATTVRVGTRYSQPTRRRLAEVPAKGKILYIVTTLAEYNSGTRSTVRGSDRLQETLIPVLSEGVRSMLADGYEVDGTWYQRIFACEGGYISAIISPVFFFFWNRRSISCLSLYHAARPLGTDSRGSSSISRTGLLGRCHAPGIRYWQRTF